MNKKYVYAVACFCFAVLALMIAYKWVFNSHTSVPDTPETAISKTEKSPEMSPEPAPAISKKKDQITGAENPAELTDKRESDNYDNLSEEDDFQVKIDPEQLAEAEIQHTYNKMFEAEARSRLPLVSIQTNNPVWSLQNEAEKKTQEKFTRAFLGSILQGLSGSGSQEAPLQASGSDQEIETGSKSEAEDNQGPEPAPESGEFGDIQPPDGEIWIRIEAEYALESRDIMVQNADLYRETTGYEGPVTITLWVGGRPHLRQVYEDK